MAVDLGTERAIMFGTSLTVRAPKDWIAREKLVKGNYVWCSPVRGGIRYGALFDQASRGDRQLKIRGKHATLFLTLPAEYARNAGIAVGDVVRLRADRQALYVRREG